MKIIISETLKDNFHEFVVVDSLKKALELNGVTVVIIHSFKESEFDAGISIPKLREQGAELFIYINENPSATTRLLISGLKGYYYADEFYFNDEEELIFLIEDIESQQSIINGKEETSLAAPSLDIVSDFIEAFARGEQRIKAPLYLERVTNAVNELSVLTHQQELQITAMGVSALEVFQKASSIISNMDTQRKLIEKKLDELEQSQNSQMNSTRPSFGNSITFFTPYSHLGNKLCIFREYTPTRYLTSFILAYAHYLKYVKNKRVKVIFVVQRGYTIFKKYDDFTCITQESMHMDTLYDAEIVVTNNPKKEVMKKLCTKPVDVILVVDRLYGNQAIVTGRTMQVNVASSNGDIKRFDLKPEETIFAVTSPPKCLFTIPTIKNFPTQSEARMAILSQVMNKSFKKLDEHFLIK